MRCARVIAPPVVQDDEELMVANSGEDEVTQSEGSGNASPFRHDAHGDISHE